MTGGAVEAARPDARPRLLFLILIVLAILRIWLGTLPGYPPDLNTYKRWALLAGMNGVHTVYDERAGEGMHEWRPGDYDYPPLYAYLLAPLGAVYGRLVPDAGESFESSKTLGFLVKIPPLVFDALLALLLGSIAARYGLWRGHRSWLGWGVGLLYLFQPAVLFDSGYWGQPDSIHVFFVILALTLILLRKPEWGWVAAALACLMKPLAVPFLPLLALATTMRGGWRKLATGGAAAIVTGLAVFLPFIVTGRGGLAFGRLFHDVDLMAYSSVNAHNLWWLLGPWRSSREPWFGPFSRTHVGLALFGLAYLTILWRLWRTERIGSDGTTGLARQGRWYVAGAGVAFSFFFFSTNLHENHLFAAIPFLILLAHKGRTWTALALLVALAAFVNMANHDLILGNALFGRGAPSSLVIPETGWRMPAAMRAIATANALFMTVLYGVFGRAAFLSLRGSGD
jgi:hypothetical protein